MSKQKVYLSASDFLNDEEFISWRLFRAEELEVHWTTFISKNPDLKNKMDEAVRKFDENVILNKTDLSHEAREKLYKKIQTRIQLHRKKNSRRVLYWSSVAACLALIVASAALFSIKQKNENFTAQNEIVGRTLSSEDVQLFVGNEAVTLQPNESITLSDGGEIYVTDSTSEAKSLKLEENKTNRLVVPFGKRSFITLADGTRVWINSGTELEFPSTFAGITRNIKVKGEIYIEVAQSTIPFHIQTQKATVRVLGTKFNIAAYEDELSESVVLVEGSVEVSVNDQTVVKLQPNQKATISNEAIETETVNVSEYISWRDGVMVFNKTTMSEVLKKIERYYNVSFDNNDTALNKKTVSGKLFLSNNLDSIMTSVSMLSSTHYERSQNRIILRKK